jgi:hypothetical protein
VRNLITLLGLAIGIGFSLNSAAMFSQEMSFEKYVSSHSNAFVKSLNEKERLVLSDLNNQAWTN